MKQSVEFLFIKPTTTIREAMETITNAATRRLPVGIVLVVDDDQRLVATVTDGDIRKAIVKGIDIEEPVGKIMTKAPITVSEGLNVDEMIREVLTKVRESGRIVSDYKVNHVIVVNDDNRVLEILNFYDLWYKQEIMRKDICIVGTGHVGLTLSVVLAELGLQVTGFDINEELIREVREGRVRFFEKGLPSLLKFHLQENNIRFVNSLEGVKADTYIICVGTPVDEATQKPINDYIEQAAESLAKVLKKDDLVILRSTVSVGTTRNVVKPILERVSQLKCGFDFYLVFAPERVVEGNAIQEIREIPQVIGGINKRSVQEAMRVLQKISPAVVLLESLESAEMVKLINNTYRDYSFAFANSVALLCDQFGLDTVRLIKAANEGYPRNPIPLPSPGVGGYCLSKDPYLLASSGGNHYLSPEIFTQSRKTNQIMPRFVADKISRFIDIHWCEEKRIKIYMIGFAFKGFPETSDMRGSSAIEVMNILSQRYSARLRWCGYDPVIKPQEIEKLKVEYMPYQEGFQDAHCTLMMTNHPDFTKMDIFAFLETKKKPGLFFDGWQFFPADEIEKIKGITYQGLGGRS